MFVIEIIASGRFVIPYLPSNKKCFDRPTRIRIHTFFYRSKCNRTNYSGKWSQSASIQCVLIFYVSPNTPQSFVRPFRHPKHWKKDTAWHSIDRKRVFFYPSLSKRKWKSKFISHKCENYSFGSQLQSNIVKVSNIARAFHQIIYEKIHIFLCSSTKKITLNCIP